ncbi:MAG TPA: HAD family hydrolase [Terracidiphilus sp.]|jgi:phosphoglycolate phosphatase-like HAD superfamily hydrolase|nr:HAD family hydrolase [Terracidiphilus sp.]
MQTTPQKTPPRVEIKPGFAWDGQDAYLFDIDGTILRSRDRVHFDSVAHGVKRVTGFEITLAGISIHGNTDTGILREACLRAGIPAETLEPQVAAILDSMCACVAERRHELDPILMPGIKEALQHLANRGALLGVATGNLEMIGWIKIEAAGLREWFRFGGFSDHFPVRSELIGHAAEKARVLGGKTARVCVVGDTPRDIEAARANHLPVIAVATGHFDFDTLHALKPDVCASSLADLLEATRTES